VELSSAPRRAHTRASHGKETEPADDWFMKPYEPSPVAAKAEEPAPNREAKPKKQIAALLRKQP